MFLSTSALVNPVEIQPAKSGTYAAQLCGALSKTTAYFFTSILLAEESRSRFLWATHGSHCLARSPDSAFRPSYTRGGFRADLLDTIQRLWGCEQGRVVPIRFADYPSAGCRFAPNARRSTPHACRLARPRIAAHPGSGKGSAPPIRHPHPRGSIWKPSAPPPRIVQGVRCWRWLSRVRLAETRP